MPEPTVEELTAAFKLADKDGNGKLTAEELKDLMLTFAEDDEDKHEVNGMVDMLMAMCDQDGDKMLNYEELAQVISGKEPDKKQKMQMMFRMFDTDGSGYVSKKELCKGMEMDDDPFMSLIVNEMIGGVDKDEDGKLNFEEFCALMENMDN